MEGHAETNDYVTHAVIDTVLILFHSFAYSYIKQQAHIVGLGRFHLCRKLSEQDVPYFTTGKRIRVLKFCFVRFLTFQTET